MRIRAPAAMRNRARAQTPCHPPLLQAKAPAMNRRRRCQMSRPCKACSERIGPTDDGAGRKRSEVAAVEGVLGLPIHQEDLRRRRRRGSPAKRAAPGRGCRDRALRPWRVELRGQKVKVAFVLTPEPEPERINSARPSLVFESQYLDRLDARRAGEEFVGLCH